jgi:NADPH2:quinone reductase
VLGANVIGTARGKDKLSIAQANGANHVIDYGEEDIRERVKAITGGRGVDVVYDPVGGKVFDQSLRCLAWEGRLLVIGFASGQIPQVPANYLLVKNIAVVGFYWGAYFKRDPAVIQRSFAELLGWFDDGLLAPHVSKTFDLEEAPAAMERMLSRKSTGKVVLTTGITRPA